MPSKPGPKLDIDDKTADAAVVIDTLGSNKLSNIIENIVNAKKRKRNDITPDTTSSSNDLLFIFTV